MVDTILSKEFPFLVGYYGYITMPAYVCFVLFADFLKNSTNLSQLLVFSSFVAINQGSNGMLKQICQQPRPANQINIVYHDSLTNSKLGMPSGHAQSVMFAFTFLYLYTKNPLVLTVGAIMTLLTLMQRILYCKHTPLQVAVGSMLGILLGHIGFNVSKIVHIDNNILNMALIILIIPVSFYVDHYNLAEKKLLPFLKISK